MEKIGLWTSGWGETSIKLVEEVYRNFPSKISYVFLSREKGESYYGDLMRQKIQELGLSLITFSSSRFKPELRKTNKEVWRLEHDRELMKILPPADLAVLLGYMWVINNDLCQKQNIINLHPAQPAGPKGTYREVIWQLIKERAKETGVMMHLVTPALDAGPVITFCRFSIRGSDFDPLWQEMEERLKRESLEEIAAKEGEENLLFKQIRKCGVKREFPMVIQTIKLLDERKVRIEDKRIIGYRGQILENGYDLSFEIDAIVSSAKKGF